jgi:LysM repeat protein
VWEGNGSGRRMCLVLEANPGQFQVRLRAVAVGAAVVLALLTASPAQAGRYVVRWGDTLTWIAQAHQMGLRRLARMNHRDPYAVLVAGTVLHVPGASPSGGPAKARYTVQWGDTLSAIASRYGVGLGRLARANGLRVRGILISGTTLRIPGHGAPHRTRHRHARRHVHHHGHHHRKTGAGWRGHYRVQAGDTLTAIGARYDVGIRRLARANGLRVRGTLLTGTRLHVPARHHGGAASPAPLPAPWSVGWSIDHWSAHYGVDAHLVRAVAWQESGFNPSAVSVAGAWGVMQVMPATWSFVEDNLVGAPISHTPDGGVRVGVAFLRHLLISFHGDVRLAVAAYYQGEAATHMFGVLPISKPYVANVLALRTRL